VKVLHRRVVVGRIDLHVAELGLGTPVLLLHGFPGYWADFREQMTALALAGYRAIAVDLPGFGQSGQLPKVLDYRADLLADDLAGLIRALHLPRVHVVGHDWGGTLAYCLSSRHPELVDCLVVLNAGHPALIRSALRRFEQQCRSWYIFLFQLPWLPERLVCSRTAIALALRGMEVRRGAFTDIDLDNYLAAMRSPGVARAALNYYRAAWRAPSRGRYPVLQRTLVLWGERDPALSSGLLLGELSHHVPNVRLVRFSNAGHWIHHDLPEVVARHLLEFLSAPADSSTALANGAPQNQHPAS